MTDTSTNQDTDDRAAPPVSRSTVQARYSVVLLFVIMGLAIGGWSARVPDVRDAVGLGNTGWGLANIATNAGELISLVVVAVLISRINTRRLALAGAALILVNAPLLAASTTVVALVGGLAVWGFAANLLATPMNAQSVEVQKQYGRPILSTFHAGFSVGMLVGGLCGTAAAAAGLSPSAQMAITSVLLGVMLLGTQRWLPDTPRQETKDGEARRRLRDRFTPQLLLLAAIAFLAAFVEMAGAQWSALYATEVAAAGAVLAAATYTCLSLAATVARLFGDRLAGRFGRVRFVRASALVAAGGLALPLTIPHPAAVMAGFGLLGFGLACVTPTVLGIAGEQPGLTSGEGVSVVAMGQWPGMLLAAPVIGLLAGAMDLRSAFVVVVVMALSIVALMGRVRAAALPGEA
ncbi:Fucose permease [Micromonospora phaseoli]|uniref:Fucose permease n=1 Tax=Micromonospora phaseoli TaxID=1144548 RepID=A0A1H7DT80_9ACTN|nr:MFS transporter [Micromonospora phaseoli]PZV99208.1 fucose permease [Micromonospora phaseoli]GIJ79996.1 MFS transporter [Micromonospora phaseoli]SEK04953.1 Fucose permease [Micromonospora phaseoli]